jgi:hypothetical protein
MAVIDLKSPISFSHTNINNLKGVANELRTDDLFANNRLPAATRIWQMCSAISRQLQNTKVFMFRSISLYVICSTYLSRKLARYCSMSYGNATKILSHRHSRFYPAFLTSQALHRYKARGLKQYRDTARASQRSRCVKTGWPLWRTKTRNLLIIFEYTLLKLMFRNFFITQTYVQS